MSHYQPLPRTMFGKPSLARDAGMVLFGSVLVAAAAQASVPMYPVPMTLQTLAITLIGLTYGSRLAGLTLIAYLAEGAAGLPVFANGAGGIPHILGPTGGFLLAFPLMAWLTGWMAENGFGRGVARLFLAAFVPSLLIFVPGVLWLSALLSMDLMPALAAAAWPFQLGGLIKSALAAIIVSAAWRGLGVGRM